MHSESIQKIYLQNNKLVSLPEGIFTTNYQQGLTQIALAGNQWYCNCTIFWLAKWVAKSFLVSCCRNFNLDFCKIARQKYVIQMEVPILPIFHPVRNVLKDQANGTTSSLMLLLIHILMFIAESGNILLMVSAIDFNWLQHNVQHFPTNTITTAACRMLFNNQLCNQFLKQSPVPGRSLCPYIAS